MRTLASNLASVAAVIAMFLLAAGAIVLAIVFGLSVLEHFTGNGADYARDYGEAAPAIKWVLLAASAGCVVVLTAAYTAYDALTDGEFYYCPNCECPDCLRERRDRERSADQAAAMAAGIAVGSGMNAGQQ